ncbi:MAG: dicarboxylate/amino acid:cation symporter [Aquificae bacterium]|nr:dicarboxylate/amino acid:cation symporter [Aquificota bacterium]
MKRLLSLENLTLLSIVLAILTGLYLPELSQKLKPLGDVFLRLLKMIIVPLVFVSVFGAILGLESISRFKKLGVRTFLYYLTTTAMAVTTGLLLVLIFQPGKGENPRPLSPHEVPEPISLGQVIMGIIPENPIKALAEGKVLQVIFFAILLGLAFLTVERFKQELVKNITDGFSDALVRLTRWVVLLTPVGVFALVSYLVARFGIDIILSLWEYVLVVVLGLLIHALVNLPLVALLFGRYNPYRYMLDVREALLIAFSTASSAATLPVSMELARTKGKVRKEVAGFVLPLGATINMDGTALYEAVAAVFIANVYGIELTPEKLITIFLTVTLASIGAAAIPGAGLVLLALVLSSAGIPLEGIGLIVAVDRFLDMLRTAVNVWGDLNGARILNKLLK